MRQRKQASSLDRFMTKFSVDPHTGCWNWDAGKCKGGYGTFGAFINGVWGKQRAHRVSYEMHHGKIDPGMHVCHSCDNRACVNPSHLFLGTHADNVADMVSKGRQPRPRGTANGNSKLTDAEIITIRSAIGETQKTLAVRFGVDQSLVSYIRSGKLWTHVSPEAN